MERTKVIFRMWDGQVIAIFPELPSSVTNWYLCDSYMHIGQHSACDPNMIINNSRLATPDEYESLKNELESHYGYNLAVYKRMTYAMCKQREETWHEWSNHEV